MLFKNTVVEAMGYALPEDVWTSDKVESLLAPAYERLRLPAGRLELMTGIRERRFWPVGKRPSEASAEAGERALAASSIDRDDIDLLIHSGVCRDRLEPSTASYVHRLLQLSERHGDRWRFDREWSHPHCTDCIWGKWTSTHGEYIALFSQSGADA